MRIGIFGSGDDLQCQAVAKAIRALGAEDVLFDAEALHQQRPVSFLGGETHYLGNKVDDVRAAYLRFIPAPYAPSMEREADGELVLYADWFNLYMQERERAAFYVSWLLRLQHQGALLLNGPQAGSVLQYKPLQLDVLRSVGARVPRTLISNDPEAIRRFHAEVKDVIYKPVMGGALTEVLDDEALEHLELVTQSPVIFQARARGEDLRVMLLGDEVISSVAIETPEQQLDFRGDDVYSSGNAGYREVELPAPVIECCRKAARALGLQFAGIDIKHHGDDWVFLELNSSPIYLDVELKLGHPISAALAKMLYLGAKERLPRSR